MKIAISHNEKPKTLEVVSRLESLLKSHHLTRDDQYPDIVISVGGDGTLIRAFHKYQDQLESVQFIGVHTGHLGFYTDWRDYNIDRLVDELTMRQPEPERYPLLDFKLTTDAGTQSFLALNEVSIKGVSQTLEADVYIKHQFFERFRGDGLCVSTPTGSTAYNKSLGGAVIHPRLKALQMAEIASINNRVFRTLSAPVVIPSDEWITIEVESNKDCVIIVDGKELELQSPIKELTYRVSNRYIRFDKFAHTSFWIRVKESFIGPEKKE